MESSVFWSCLAHSNLVLKLGLNFHSYITFFNYLSWLKMAFYRNEDLVIIHPQSNPRLNRNLHFHITFFNEKTFKKDTTETKTIYMISLGTEPKAYGTL